MSHDSVEKSPFLQGNSIPAAKSSSFLESLFRTKSVDRVLLEHKSEESASRTLKKCLSFWDLIGYGIGVTVGAGVYVLAGVAAKHDAGPGIVLSYLFAGIACTFSALTYSEFAARVPVAGSAYTYAYTSLGELVAWLIGWNLTLEYGISGSAIARGWSGYTVELMKGMDLELPQWMNEIPLFGGAIVASPLAALLIVICTVFLVLGIKESAALNRWLTALNLIIIIFSIVVGSFYVDVDNWKPFLPYGTQGVFTGAGTVFFSFIGFECVSSLAEETRNPQRDLPLGILGSLFIATSLYVAVSFVLTGMVPTSLLDSDAPLAIAFYQRGLPWAGRIISIGSVLSLMATTLCCLIGQPRIFFRMAKDGLLFPAFASIHPKFQTPITSTIFTGALTALLAFLLDINILSQMISVGTLLAFSVVSASVLILRYRPVQTSSPLNIGPLTRSHSPSYPVTTTTSGGGNSSYPHVESYPNLTSASAGASDPSLTSYKIDVSILVAWLFFGSAAVSFLASQTSLSTLVDLLLAIPLILAPLVLLSLRPHSSVPSSFKCPLVPLVPALSIISNLYMTSQLPWGAWLRLAVWLLLGLILYFFYGRTHSTLASGPSATDDPSRTYSTF